jgi:hypothetical protein
MGPSREAAQLHLRLMLRRPRSGRLEARGGPRLPASPHATRSACIFRAEPADIRRARPVGITRATACPGCGAARSGAPLVRDLREGGLWCGPGSAAHHFAIAREDERKRP